MEIRKYGDRTSYPLNCPEKGRTHQSFKEECDINVVVAMHQRTGSLQHVNVGTPTYGDYSEVGSYQEALDTVIAAQDAFMALPAKVRTRMGNNPAVLLEFLANPDNKAEAQKLGLVETPALIIDGEEILPATFEPWTRAIVEAKPEPIVPPVVEPPPE